MMADCYSKGEQWRSEILHDLTKIPSTGFVPGVILVWGHLAQPILNSAGPSKHVLIAAAELGNGRIVVLAHESVLDCTPGLMQNIEKWLTKGKQCKKHTVNRRSKSSDIKGIDVIMYKGAPSTGGITTEAVVNHVIRGGGLIHAACPWGWLQVNKGKMLSDMPLAGVLELIGVCYTGQHISIPGDGLDIQHHKSTEANHLGITLHRLIEDPEHFCDEDSMDLPIDYLCHLPDYVCTGALCHELKRLAQALGCEKDSDQPDDDNKTTLVKKLCPQHDNPIKGRNQRALINILDKMACLELASVPGIENFVGCIPPGVESSCRMIKITSHLKDVHPTGLYLNMDSTLIFKVQGTLPTGWILRIGAHSDDLTKVKTPLTRWPCLVIKKQINCIETKLYSPYGGLLYLESPENASEIEACVENVVEAPLFDAYDPESIKHWKQRRQAAGPWADIIGKLIIITLPSTSVQHIENPCDVMYIWDGIISGYHELRGTDPHEHRRQWIVTDEQPVAGYMHAGYPIVTHMDVARPNAEKFLLNEHVLLDTGSWGIYHELGHNMQRRAWTFHGTGEVTCNIFTLYAMDTVSGQPVWIHKWLKPNLKKVEKYIGSSEPYDTWKSDPALALFIYAQIVHHFGWDVYKNVFRQYEDGDQLDDADNEVKIDTWFTRISEACGHDLGPLFSFWKIPVSLAAVHSLQHLKPCLPHDEVTDINMEYANQIREKYQILHSQ